MRKISFMIGLGVLLFSMSCKRTLPDYGGTSAQKMANGWWVALYAGGSALQDPVFFSTYNTSENKDSIWLDDLTLGYQFKCKAKADFKNLTFSTTGSQNMTYNITVQIMNGKVLPKAGHSRSGVATDSLYMQAIFSDDPTTTYEIKGTARTGLVEDDY
jgi:hypothetical protein